MPRRVKKRHRPAGSFTVRLEDLAHDGRAVGHREGKAVFVRGGLPGELVSFTYTACHRNWDEGVVDRVIEPSPDRVEPRCPHFGLCGGCSLQHLDPAEQIVRKQAWLLENLARIGKVQPQRTLAPLRGPPWGYRRKARLGVKYVAKKGRVLVGFREYDNPFVADLRRCEVLHPRVGALLEELGELIGGLSLYNRLPQIEVAVGDNAVALSFRVLDTPTAQDLRDFIAFGQRHDVQIHLQSKGPETTELLWPEKASLCYRLPEYGLEMAFRPFHFTQINGEINAQMASRAIALMDLSGDDHVLDLFCGLGNFTLPLARYAGSVTGIEGDPHLLAWAKDNATHNGIDNAAFFAADLSTEIEAQPWLQHRYTKVLLDPPRSGALEVMPKVAALHPTHVVYVSCHPATLARDAGVLVHGFGYKIRAAGVMDMFPHTAHVESMALFEKSS